MENILVVPAIDYVFHKGETSFGPKTEERLLIAASIWHTSFLLPRPLARNPRYDAIFLTSGNTGLPNIVTGMKLRLESENIRGRILVTGDSSRDATDIVEYISSFLQNREESRVKVVTTFRLGRSYQRLFEKEQIQTTIRWRRN